MRDIVLKLIQPGVILLAQIFDLQVDAPALHRSSGCNCPSLIVNNSTVEVKPSSTARFATTIASDGFVNSAAHHRIDIHVELGMLRQHLQPRIQRLQTLLRNLSGWTLSMLICM